VRLTISDDMLSCPPTVTANSNLLEDVYPPPDGVQINLADPMDPVLKVTVCFLFQAVLSDSFCVKVYVVVDGLFTMVALSDKQVTVVVPLGGASRTMVKSEIVSFGEAAREDLLPVIPASLTVMVTTPGLAPSNPPPVGVQVTVVLPFATVFRGIAVAVL